MHDTVTVAVLMLLGPLVDLHSTLLAAFEHAEIDYKGPVVATIPCIKRTCSNGVCATTVHLI